MLLGRVERATIDTLLGLHALDVFKVNLQENSLSSLNINGTLPGMEMAVPSADRSSAVHPLVRSSLNRAAQSIANSFF